MQCVNLLKAVEELGSLTDVRASATSYTTMYNSCLVEYSFGPLLAKVSKLLD